MNDSHYNADFFAEQVDRFLETGQLPDDDPLLQTVQRLLNAPRPEMTATRLALLRTVVLEHVPPPSSLSWMGLLSIKSVLFVIGVGVALLVGVYFVFFADEESTQVLSTTASPSATLTLTETPSLTPTLTPSPTSTLILSPASSPSQTANPTASPSFSATPTVTPTFTALSSATPSPTLSPSATLTALPLPVIIIIEGDVEAIEGNIIRIYDIPIRFTPDDPILKTIRIGDRVRIEGTLEDSEARTVTVVTIVFIEVDVFVNPDTGDTFRDDSSCDNPPPSWAPANGWRARCEGAPPPSNDNSGRGNQGRGRGNDDDDNDDDD